MDTISKFPLVTMEKWQGSQATDASGKPVFLWEEDAWVAAAKQIKAARPDTSVIAWMDTMLVYTGWNVDPSNHTVNTTLNPDATANCATGHFRPAEDLERGGKGMLLRNKTGGDAEYFGNCHVFDHSQPQARDYWKQMCLRMTGSGVIDGCGADFSAMGQNSWAAHTPAMIAAGLGLSITKATAWAAGHRQMMAEVQEALGAGLLIGKDPVELGDHVNAVLQEGGCYKRNSTVNGLRALATRRKAAGDAGKAWVYQCHGQSADNSTMAAFLAGASDGDFLTVGGWYDGVDGHWGDDFARPLGPPLADAVYNGTAWHREFASGTKVTFTPHTNAAGKDMGGVGSISWGAKAF